MYRENIPDIPDAEKICFNCANFAQTVDNQSYKYGEHYGICAANVFDVDACGKSITVLHKGCTCIHSAECSFEPLTEYLDELQEMSLPLHEVYGVLPGVNFPSSLSR